MSEIDNNLLATETNSLQTLKSKKNESTGGKIKEINSKTDEEEVQSSAYQALTSRFPTLAKERESVIMEIVNSIGTSKKPTFRSHRDKRASNVVSMDLFTNYAQSIETDKKGIWKQFLNHKRGTSHYE